MLLGPVVDDSILDLTRKADASPDILEYLPLLLFVVSALGDLLKLLTLATFLEEVEVDSLVGKDFAAGTAERYRTCKKHVAAYVKKKYKKNDIPFFLHSF